MRNPSYPELLDSKAFFSLRGTNEGATQPKRYHMSENPHNFPKICELLDLLLTCSDFIYFQIIEKNYFSTLSDLHLLHNSFTRSIKTSHKWRISPSSLIENGRWGSLIRTRASSDPRACEIRMNKKKTCKLHL